MITKVGDVQLTDEYWDCECEHFYIHPKSDACCEICSARREESPDSRVDEVLAGGYTISNGYAGFLRCTCGAGFEDYDHPHIEGCPARPYAEKSIEKLIHIAEALHDVRNGKLSEGAFIFAVGFIVEPKKQPTKEQIEYAQQELEKYADEQLLRKSL